MSQVPDSEKRRVVAGREFLQALIDEGFVRPEDRVTRVVIDARVNGVVNVYVDRLGDERLLKLLPTLHGIEITREPGAMPPQ